MTSALLLALALAAEPSLPPPATPAGAEAPEAKATPAPGAPSGLKALASDKPVKVDADQVRFNWNTRRMTVVGKPLVTLTHDDATLSCRKLTGDNDPQGKLARATCEGDVRLTRGTRVVTCDRATYDRDGATVVCTGKPLLKDGGTEARAEKLVYDLGADEVRLEGAAQVTVPGDQLDLGKLGGPAAAPKAEAKR
ncbi:MAG TPA: LptA/OstA family protein [Anaeromyxobacteraceae bacterium]|nr:LptA/OstA family protein [Anaeromyxobacteraceae bacterium]